MYFLVKEAMPFNKTGMYSQLLIRLEFEKSLFDSLHHDNKATRFGKIQNL